MEKVGGQVQSSKEKNFHNGFLILLSFRMICLTGLDKLNNWPEKVKTNAKKLDWKVYRM